MAHPYSTAPSHDQIPPLDGLRGIAVGLVLEAHLGFWRIVPGGLGVTLFFFISGLLITRQLLAERAATGRIALGAFWIRRALRLYPALLVMVVLGGGAFALAGGRVTPGDALAALLYLSNYHLLGGGFRSFLPHIYHPFSVLWSLAVEEHFYLVFPVLVAWLAADRRRFALLLVAGIVVVALWRLHVQATWPGDAELRIDRGTDTRADAILFGALLATWLGCGTPPGWLLGRGAFAAGIGLVLAGLLLRDPAFRETHRYTMVSAGCFLATAPLLFGPHLGGLRAMLSRPEMRRLGRWSYSLYLWHWVALVLVSMRLPARVWVPAADGHFPRLWYVTVMPALYILSFAAAVLSYRVVEQPMLVLRRRFGSHAPVAALTRAADNDRGAPPLRA
jgi:peptidoglycan/LPS O-acetylase OafA/YrhL